MIQNRLETNITKIETLFGKDPTLIIRRFSTPQPSLLRCAVLFFDGMVDGEYVSENIIRRVMAYPLPTARRAADSLLEHAIDANEIKKTNDPHEMAFALSSGDCVLFFDNDDEAVVFSAKGYIKRSVAEPENERTMRGPREGFIEPLIPNLSLLRRRLKSEKLRLEYIHFENTSKQTGCICYLEGVADKKVLNELKTRLSRIKLTDAMDINYISEQVRDHPFSPFRTTGLTERPDVVSAKLLEGRVALFLDGSPFAMTVPFIFIEYFHNPDDYYQNYTFASFSRILRIICFALTISVPALYVAIVSFHQELMPTSLLISIATARAGVPFPLIVETVLLLTAFEILRDASLKMSSTLGQSLSIVGALILGEASVSARIVSAPLIIVAALTAIAGLINPQLKSVSVFFRFALLIIASFSGFYGLIFGLCIFALFLSGHTSFGVRTSDYLVPASPRQAKDTVVRLPWNVMKYSKIFGGKDEEGS